MGDQIVRRPGPTIDASKMSAIGIYMRKYTKVISKLAAIFMLASLFAFSSLHANTSKNKELLVSDFEENRVDVKDYVGDGRWTVVMLWQLDCIPCEEQKPAVEAFHKKYKSSSAHVVGLVIDGHDYMPEIKAFVDKKPTAFPSYVVLGDVFNEQIEKETGKLFPAAPGYLIYTPSGELDKAINSRVNINDLIGYVENKFGS